MKPTQLSTSMTVFTRNKYHYTDDLTMIIVSLKILSVMATRNVGFLLFTALVAFFLLHDIAFLLLKRVGA